MKIRIKSMMLFIFAIIMAGTLTIGAVASKPEFVLKNKDMDVRMLKENEANIEYSLLMTSYKHAISVRNGCIKNNDNAYPDYYAGSYLDDNGELIVLTTSFDTSVEEIRNITRNQNTAVSYAKYSYNDLTEVKELIENKYQDYYNMYANNVSGANSDLIRTLVNFTGVGISERSNRVVVDLSCVDQESINLFEKYFVSSDLICYEQSDVAEEEASSLYCGSAIYTVNGGGSIGFRCTLKKGTQYLRGFITAGHVTGNGEFINVYSSSSLTPSAKIGTLQAYKYEGKVDMAFVAIDSNYTVEARTAACVLGENYYTSIAEGTTIYMSGMNVAESAGKIEKNSYSFKSASGVALSDCIKSTYSSSSGDSGGVVYGYINGDNCIVGIHHGTKTEWFKKKALTIKACNIYDTYDFYKY